MNTRKRRTRAHVVADLSVNHVEGIALRAGFTVERVTYDYGTDLLLTTYDAAGQIESGYVYMQLKATDNLSRLCNGTVTVSVDERDVRLWLDEFYPVILIVYDAVNNRAYWLHVQGYFDDVWGKGGVKLSAFRTARFPRRSRLDMAAMMEFSDLKSKIYRRIRGLPNGR